MTLMTNIGPRETLSHRGTLPSWSWGGQKVPEQLVEFSINTQGSRITSALSGHGPVKQIFLNLPGNLSIGATGWDPDVVDHRQRTPYFLERLHYNVKVGNFVKLVEHLPIGSNEKEVVTASGGFSAQGGTMGGGALVSLSLSAGNSTSQQISGYRYIDETAATSTSITELYAARYELAFVNTRKSPLGTTAPNPDYDRSNRKGVMMNPFGLNKPPTLGYSAFPILHQSTWLTVDDTGLNSINTVSIVLEAFFVCFAQKGLDVNYKRQGFGQVFTFDIDLSEIEVMK